MGNQEVKKKWQQEEKVQVNLQQEEEKAQVELQKEEDKLLLSLNTFFNYFCPNL